MTGSLNVSGAADVFAELTCPAPEERHVYSNKSLSVSRSVGVPYVGLVEG